MENSWGVFKLGYSGEKRGVEGVNGRKRVRDESKYRWRFKCNNKRKTRKRVR